MSIKESKSQLKIIHAGFHRGASTSVGEALKILGCGPVFHTVISQPGWEWIRDGKSLSFWRRNKYDKKLQNGEYIDLDEWVEMVQCPVIMDAPITTYWDKFVEQYPEAKVIVTIRDGENHGFDKWYNSMQSLMNLMYSLSYTLMAYFTAPITGEAYWMRNVYLTNYFNKFEIGNKDKARQRYLEHIGNVKNKVPAQQRLIYTIGTGWEPLCRFLNKQKPEQDFPFSNNRASLTKLVYIGVGFEAIISGLVYGGILYGCWCGYKYVNSRKINVETIKNYIFVSNS